MLNMRGQRPVCRAKGITRRDFLRAGSLGAGAVGLSLANLGEVQGSPSPAARSCILLFLVGGPSQLDTWDLKPGAPSNVRGPFKPIRTNVPGIEICEHFPLMAKMADRFAIVRSVHHPEALIHEAGQQIMQTGHAFDRGVEYPHYGAVLSHKFGHAAGAPAPFVLLPGPMGSTGAGANHGQGAGFLGRRHNPCSPSNANFPRTFALTGESDAIRQRYGANAFGQSCLLARRMVERGVRLVTVNMGNTIFNTVSWDCHADGASVDSSLDDYRDTLCPIFDRAYSALLEDLQQRGLLDRTLVVVMGEFGRTPHFNPRGGRDHWPGVWSMLFAGGGIRGGQVVGASDRLGGEPRDRPVSPAEVAATVFRAMGFDPVDQLPSPDGRPLPLADAAPIGELF